MIFLQFNDCLFPIGRSTVTELVATQLALAVLRSHFLDLHLEQLLTRTLHVELRRFAMNFECVLIIPCRSVHTLLGNQRTQQNLMRL